MQFAKRLINTIKEHFRLKLLIALFSVRFFPFFVLGTISYKISYNIAKDNMLKRNQNSV